MNTRILLASIGYLALITMLGAAVAFAGGHIADSLLKQISLLATVVWFTCKISKDFFFAESE